MSVFEKPPLGEDCPLKTAAEQWAIIYLTDPASAFWRTVLTTKDKAKAEAMAKEIGDKVRVAEIQAEAEALRF